MPKDLDGPINSSAVTNSSIEEKQDPPQPDHRREHKTHRHPNELASLLCPTAPAHAYPRTRHSVVALGAQILIACWVTVCLLGIHFQLQQKQGSYITLFLSLDEFPVRGCPFQLAPLPR